MNNKPRPWLLVMTLAALTYANSFALELLVYNNNPVGAGSLRQAVLNNNALGGGHTIIFSNIVTGVIPLASELPLTNNVSIVGPGANILRISGGGTNRVMLVSNAVVSLSGLLVANGSAFIGAGILQSSGTLILDRCIVATNFGTVGVGISSSGTLVISNSTITRNQNSGMLAADSATGVRVSGDATFASCTISHNIGGGFYGAVGGAGTMRFDTCTIYGNQAAQCGGINLNSGSLFVTNCTITANVSSLPSPGLRVFSGTAVVRNTIVAGNTVFSGNSGDCSGTFTSAGFNLIGKASGSSGWSALGDQTGTTNSPLNASLGPLRDNGGLTFTVAPFANSPAIDQGHSGTAATDQRGYLRPHDRPEVPNAPGGNGADIGAFEATVPTLVVTNLNDNGPGSLRQAILDAVPQDNTTITLSNLAGTLSLSSVLLIEKELTIAGPGANLLALSGNYNTRIFMVLSGRLNLSGLTLRDAWAGATVASQELDGIMERGGAIFNQAALNLADCVVTNCVVKGGDGGPTQDGFAGNGGKGFGGAIANIGTLTLNRCTLAGNAAYGGAGGIVTGSGSAGMGGQASGGALYNADTVFITNCTFSGSQAISGIGGGGSGSAAGGGIYNELNAVVMTSTVASNSASGSGFDLGGGVYDNGTSCLIRNSTIAGNASGFGGGLYSANTDLGNSILAANTSSASSGDGSGTIQSSDYNLVQNNSNLTIQGATTHNLLGQNPMLGPLQHNGGPTMTMALLASSPAIDRGKNFGPAVDQRGRGRPYDFANKTNAGGGDGSDIGAFEVTPPILSITQLGGNVLVSWSTNDTGYTLESKTTLNPGLWSTVPGLPSVVGNQFVVTNVAVGNNYYRLKQ